MNLEVKDENLSNHQEFEVTAGSLRDNLTTLIKNFKSKARQEIANTSLAGENVSKNKGFLRTLQRDEADAQKRQPDTKNGK